MNCNRCRHSGFLNVEQVPESMDLADTDAVLAWLLTEDGWASDVQVCDCCGDGDSHYGTPGKHYTGADPEGDDGPYRHNGGFSHCH